MMIAHLQLNTNKKYWLLPTDNRFEYSLEQIDCPDEEIMIFLKNDTLRQYPVVFIGFRVEEYSSEKFKDCWGWNEYHGKNSCVDYDYSDYEFKGLINMVEGEPELLVTVNKYNL